MISREKFDKLNQIKGNHKIGVQISNVGIPQEEYNECFEGKGCPSLFICDADEQSGKNGYVCDGTPDGLYDGLEELGGEDIGELMESLFEFSNIEQLGEVVLLADEVRNG